jgi:transposase
MDVHKKSCTMTAIDDAGREISCWKMPTTPAQLNAFIRGVPTKAKIALEASTTGKAVAHWLRNAKLDAHMASPRELAAIRASGVVTDERASYHIAHLFRNNYFPESYIPSVETDRVRDLTRFRIRLGRDVASIKNQIHALVSKNLFDSEITQTDMFGKTGLQKLVSLPFSDQDRSILKSHLEHLTLLIRQEEQYSEELARIGKGRPDVGLAMSIPGIDFYGAIGILGEIGDVHRFATRRKLYSYCGLVPGADNSGEQVSTHRRCKRGNSVLKYFLCNAVQGAIRASKPNSIAKFYKKKAKQIGHGKAQVAAARKLAGILWTILMTETPYIEENPALTQRKMARMELKAKAPIHHVTTEELNELASNISAKEQVLKRLLPEDEEE